MTAAVSNVRREMQEDIDSLARSSAEEQLLDLLLPSNHKPNNTAVEPDNTDETEQNQENRKNQKNKEEKDSLFPIEENETKEETVVQEVQAEPNSPEQKVREKFRHMLHKGELDERMVELPNENAGNGMNFVGGANVEIFTNIPEELGNLGENLQEAFSNFIGHKRSRYRKVPVKKAKEILLQEHREKLVDDEAAIDLARDHVENRGIIFIDEIDKIAVREGRSRGGSGEVSREGVQRDILPIVEGSQIRTRYGMIDTTHILFIAAGAFNLSKPSDLIPELQGRFPLRVELESLTAESLEAILSTPKNSLIFQYTKLLETENVHLNFEPSALKKIASIASEVNANTEDIGARRLHTVLETLIEDISFHASEHAGQTVTIDEGFVSDKLRDIATDQDLSRYIL